MIYRITKICLLTYEQYNGDKINTDTNASLCTDTQTEINIIPV